MILDKTTLFSDGQAITATAGSDNTIDLGAVGTILGAAGAMPFDFGKGSKIPLLVQVTQTFTNLTSLKIDVELDSTTSFTPDETITLGTFTLAQLVAGFQVPFDVLPKGLDLRYMRLKYTVTGTAPDAGKITAGISMGNQTA